MTQLSPPANSTPPRPVRAWERILHGIYLIWLVCLLVGGASWIDSSLRQGHSMVAVFLPLVIAGIIMLAFMSRQVYLKAHQALLRLWPAPANS